MAQPWVPGLEAQTQLRRVPLATGYIPKAFFRFARNRRYQRLMLHQQMTNLAMQQTRRNGDRFEA